MKRYLKSIFFLFSFLLISVFLGLQVIQSYWMQKNLDHLFVHIIKQQTSFKNWEISHQSIHQGKWNHPLSFVLKGVAIRDQNNGIAFIEELTVCWSIPALIQGSLTPTKISIRNGHWQNEAHATIATADLTIHLNSVSTLELDRLNFNPDVLATMALCPPALKALLATVHLPITATGHMGLIERELTNLEITIKSIGGDFSAPPAFLLPVPVENLHINLTLEAPHQIKVLLNATSKTSQLQAKGRFVLPRSLSQFWQEGGKIEATLLGNVVDVALDDLAQLWPVGLAPKPRAWVTENLTHGTASGTLNAVATFHSQPQGQISDMIIHDLSGELFAKDVTVNYLGDLPPVTQTHGHCRYNQQQFIIDKIGGTVNGMQLTWGQIIIDGLGKKDQHIQLILDLMGDVGQAIEIISAAPLNLLQKLGLPLKNLQGFSTTRLFLKFPLESNVTIPQVHVEAKSHLTGVTAQLDDVAGQSIDLTQGYFDLSVDSDHLSVSGATHLNLVPSQLNWTEYFKQPPDGWMRQLELHGTKTFVDDKEKDSPLIQGAVPFKVLYQKKANDQIYVTFHAALDDAMLSLPWFSYYKKPGEIAACHLEATGSKGGELIIQQGNLTGKDLRVGVSGNWGKPSSQLKISPLQVGETHGNLTLSRKDNRLKIDGNIQGFDALTLLNKLPDNQSSTPCLLDSLDLNLTIETLVFSNDYHLKNATLKVQLTNDELQTIHLKDKAEAFNFMLTPAENGVQEFNLESTNAAELLEILSPGNDLRGGKINFIGQRNTQGPHPSIKGEIDIRGLTVVEAPLLARILSLSSIQGIINAISGQGLNFDHGHATINWKEGALMIQDAALFGSALGLTFSGIIAPETLDFTGEVIPFYSINSLLSKVPLIGQILSGQSTHAIFSTPFSVAGQKDAPVIQVHGFKTLTPRGIRKSID